MKSCSEFVRLKTNMIVDGKQLSYGTVVRRSEIPERLCKRKSANRRRLLALLYFPFRARTPLGGETSVER